MATPTSPSHVFRFQGLEVDLRAGELCRNGVRLKLQDQPLQILSMLLERPGEVVTREEIRQKLWPTDTFVEFDHSINAAIQRLRQALRDSAEHPRFVETLPRRGYRFIAPLEHVATPAVVATSSPESPSSGDGNLPATAAHREGSFRPASTGGYARRAVIAAVQGALDQHRARVRWRRYAVAGTACMTVFVVALVLLLVLNVGGLRDWLKNKFTPVPKIESIAVLPFKNLSGEQEEYFADGMTDELITTLGRIGALRVISRQSVMRYKNSNKPLPEIARELNVQAIVEGAVLRSGHRVRITANLLYAPGDRHLWADNFESAERDVLVLQSEVAQRIAQEIRVQVTPQERARLTSPSQINPEAHDAYLKGRFFSRRETRQDLPKAIRYLQQAIQIDPNYAAAYAELAGCYYNRSESRMGNVPNAEAAEKTRATALKALELDGSLAHAHVVLGTVHDGFDWDMPGAEREFRRAIELDPNLVIAHVGLAWHLTFVGRFDEAIQEVNCAVELDPVSEFAIAHQGIVSYFTRHFDQAIQQARKRLELFPDSPKAYELLGYALEARGMHHEAVEAWQKQMTLQREGTKEVAALGNAYKRGGMSGVWRWRLERLKKEAARRKVRHYDFAVWYSLLGEKDKAFEYLEKAFLGHGQEMVFLLVEPRYDNLRSDPRYLDLLRRAGLLQYRRPPALRGTNSPP